MRIGLYGMPCSGKTYILEKIDFFDVIHGSKTLKQFDPLFNTRDTDGKNNSRELFAKELSKRDNFIMDGHYSFGDDIVFTKEDGSLYDIFIYLYVDPTILKYRLNNSKKNNIYSKYDIKEWQNNEILNLRDFCHRHNKDFYILDYPPKNEYVDTEKAISFINDILHGFSCINHAKKCANHILSHSQNTEIILLDGDKTITQEDTSRIILGYSTKLFDNNFYTGYQSWLQNEEFKEYDAIEIDDFNITFNKFTLSKINDSSYILTSGNTKIWTNLSKKLNIHFFNGREMSAETKLYIVKFLQEQGKKVIAFGDSMNDYYMLKQADESYLITKNDGTISKSLINKDLGGIEIVRTK